MERGDPGRRVRRLPPEIQRLIREVRSVVKNVAPGAEEKAYRGWPIRIRTERGMLAIAGFKDHVNVNLGKRSRLKDPKHLLEGTGKSIRHVKVRTAADARSDALRDLIEQELGTGPRRMTITEAARDRILEQLRKALLAFAEVTERPSHGAPTFFFRKKKAFVMVLADFPEDGRFAIWCVAPSGAQRALVKADPDRFFVPPYVGHRGWLGVRLDRKIGWDELAGILKDAYSEVAPAARRRRA